MKHVITAEDEEGNTAEVEIEIWVTEQSMDLPRPS